MATRHGSFWGGAGLLAAFPVAYSAILSALYLPVVLMLIALIFRGVAFEFRFKAPANRRHMWDMAFIGGSAAATFFQGVILGAFLEDLPTAAATSFWWCTPFPLFVGVGLMVAYSSSGAHGWL